jgi:hypothetical protein
MEMGMPPTPTSTSTRGLPAQQVSMGNILPRCRLHGEPMWLLHFVPIEQLIADGKESKYYRGTITVQRLSSTAYMRADPRDPRHDCTTCYKLYASDSLDTAVPAEYAYPCTDRTAGYRQTALGTDFTPGFQNIMPQSEKDAICMPNCCATCVVIR